MEDDEVAAELGISPATVRSRMKDAHARMGFCGPPVGQATDMPCVHGVKATTPAVRRPKYVDVLPMCEVPPLLED